MVLIYANPWCDLSHWSVVSQNVHLYLWSWKKDVFSGVIVALLSWFYPAVAADVDSCECVLVSDRPERPETRDYRHGDGGRSEDG